MDIGDAVMSDIGGRHSSDSDGRVDISDAVMSDIGGRHSSDSDGRVDIGDAVMSYIGGRHTSDSECRVDINDAVMSDIGGRHSSDSDDRVDIGDAVMSYIGGRHSSDSDGRVDISDAVLSVSRYVSLYDGDISYLHIYQRLSNTSTRASGAARTPSPYTENVLPPICSDLQQHHFVPACRQSRANGMRDASGVTWPYHVGRFPTPVSRVYTVTDDGVYRAAGSITAFSYS